MNDVFKGGVEILDVHGKLRGNSQWTETQHEREKIGNRDDYEFTFSSPVERVMRIVRRLRDQDRAFISGLFDEMMGSEVSHDFRPGENLDMQLLLELMNLPLIMDIQNTWLLNHLVPEKKARAFVGVSGKFHVTSGDALYLYGDDATDFAILLIFSC